MKPLTPPFFLLQLLLLLLHPPAGTLVTHLSPELDGTNQLLQMMNRRLKPVMLQLLLQVLALHAVADGRKVPASEHFSRLVHVSVVEGAEGMVQVLAGPLHLHLERAEGTQLLRRVLAQEVSDFPAGSSSLLILMTSF